MSYSDRAGFPFTPSGPNSHYRFSPYRGKEKVYCGPNKRYFNNSSGRENNRSFVENRYARYSINSPVRPNSWPGDGNWPMRSPQCPHPTSYNSPADGNWPMSSPQYQQPSSYNSPGEMRNFNHSPESTNSSSHSGRTKKRYFSDLSSSNSSNYSPGNNNTSRNEQWPTPCSSRTVRKAAFSKTRCSARSKLDDISLYYDPTCMENPWAELEESYLNKETPALKSENINESL